VFLCTRSCSLVAHLLGEFTHVSSLVWKDAGALQRFSMFFHQLRRSIACTYASSRAMIEEYGYSGVSVRPTDGEGMNGALGIGVGMDGKKRDRVSGNTALGQAQHLGSFPSSQISYVHQITVRSKAVHKRSRWQLSLLLPVLSCPRTTTTQLTD
jgi:hypothetical protein